MCVCMCVCVCVCVRGVFSYIRRLSLIFWGFKMLSFNIFCHFQTNEYFGGMVEIVDIFGGSLQIWSILGVISINFRGLS